MGSTPIAVACNFQSLRTDDGDGSPPPKQLVIYFSNNNASGNITVTCTLLTSYQGSQIGYAVTKTTPPIPPDFDAEFALVWVGCGQSQGRRHQPGRFLHRRELHAAAGRRDQQHDPEMGHGGRRGGLISPSWKRGLKKAEWD